jgi:hypothetical protein
MGKVISCGERTLQVKDRVALSDIAKKYGLKPGDIVRVTVQKVENDKDETDMIISTIKSCIELISLSSDCIDFAINGPDSIVTSKNWCSPSDSFDEKSKKLYECSVISEIEARITLRKLIDHLNGKSNISEWYNEPMLKFNEFYEIVGPIIKEHFEIAHKEE